MLALRSPLARGALISAGGAAAGFSEEVRELGEVLSPRGVLTKLSSLPLPVVLEIRGASDEVLGGPDGEFEPGALSPLGLGGCGVSVPLLPSRSPIV